MRCFPAEQEIQLPALYPEYLPGLHEMQLVPPEEMNLPAEQAKQASVSSPVALSMSDFPAEQEVQLAEPIPEYLPVSHREQVDDPGVLHFPAAQL